MQNHEDDKAKENARKDESNTPFIALSTHHGVGMNILAALSNALLAAAC